MSIKVDKGRFLIRVPYGKRDTPEDMREYKINGEGPVGTLAEYDEYFPDESFKIIDNIINKKVI